MACHDRYQINQVYLNTAVTCGRYSSRGNVTLRGDVSDPRLQFHRVSEEEGFARAGMHGCYIETVSVIVTWSPGTVVGGLGMLVSKQSVEPFADW